MSQELQSFSVKDLRDLLDQKKISAYELTKTYLKAIDQKEKKINAFITVTEKNALDQARKADKRIAEGGKTEPLTGIPVAVKDMILIKDIKTTAGSKFLKEFIPPYDSTVIKKLKLQGAVFLGKTNCDEFAMGSSNENSAFGPVKNPWNTKYVPGGSSGGSAAAVAAKETPLALGTDTGGSIRQPAALCGIVGLKPTYGRVSRYGIVAFASSLDQVGPMARTVDDTAILFEAIAGYDPMDSTSANVPLDLVSQEFPKLANGLRGLRVGYPKEYLPKGIPTEVRENFMKSLKTLESLGASIEEISLPHTDYASACYYIIAPAEASANLARYDGIRYTQRSDKAGSISQIFTKSRTENFGAEVRRRILLGTFVLSSGYYDAYYRKALKVRTLIQRDFSQAFEKVDVLATPTSPTPAFELESKTKDPLQMYLSDIFTVAISIAGLPAVSLPTGFTAKGLPIGFQLIGKPFDEASILRTGYLFESESKIDNREPEV